MRYILGLFIFSRCSLPSFDDYAFPPQEPPAPLVDPVDPRRDWHSIMDGFWKQQDPCDASVGDCTLELKVVPGNGVSQCAGTGWVLQVTNYYEAAIHMFVFPCFYSNGVIDLSDKFISGVEHDHLHGYVEIEPLSQAHCEDSPTGHECIEGTTRYTLHTTLQSHGVISTHTYVKIADPKPVTIKLDEPDGRWLSDSGCAIGDQNCLLELRRLPVDDFFSWYCPESDSVLFVTNPTESGLFFTTLACFTSETEFSFCDLHTEDPHELCFTGFFNETSLSITQHYHSTTTTRTYHRFN